MSDYNGSDGSLEKLHDNMTTIVGGTLAGGCLPYLFPVGALIGVVTLIGIAAINGVIYVLAPKGKPTTEKFISAIDGNFSEMVGGEFYPSIIEVKKLECEKSYPETYNVYECDFSIKYQTTLTPKVDGTFEGKSTFIHHQNGNWTEDYPGIRWPKQEWTKMNGKNAIAFPRPK